ncbi:hypothetical protein UlMin_029306 [Ulmus minor]
MADQELEPSSPPCLHLVSAFLAMEPTDNFIALARICGEGSVTEEVQRFIWSHCISKVDGTFHAPYLKSFLKKLISELELNHSVVLDELYELYAHYMTSMKDDKLVKGNTRVEKCVSFLFPDDSFKRFNSLKSKKLLIPLQCSLNMLEGDTGCSLWPSSLYLSEFILSFPELFSNKLCFEVGSGVGLVGICLAHVKASEVTLTDGDLLTLANMKLNLELNDLSIEADVPGTTDDSNKVNCIHLPWESATESDLQSFKPDIILGADVIYDPLCLPHLVRVLAILANQTKSYSQKQNEILKGPVPESCGLNANFFSETGSLGGGLRKGPLVFIASVIRNMETFNKFIALVDQANLIITDLTEELKPFNLLPYMKSYDRTNVRLFVISRE